MDRARHARWSVVLAGVAVAALLVPGVGAAAPGFATPTLLSIPAGASSPPNAAVTGIACADPTDCVAVGTATSASFVDAEVGGVWATPQLVPQIAGANFQSLDSVSCPAVGQCLAVGEVTFISGGVATSKPFTVAESSGTWGAPTDAVPNPGGESGFVGVSCSSAEACIAVGWDSVGASSSAGFEDTESAGVWQSSVSLAGTPSGDGYAQPTAVSCSASGCVVVGDYEDPLSTSYPPSGGYEQTETGGTWGGMRLLTRGLNQFTELNSVSCVRTSECVAVGVTDTIGPGDIERPIGVQERAGSWSAARELPVFSPAANDAELDAVACAPSDSCVATGTLLLTAGGIHDAGLLPSRILEYSLTSGVWSTPAVLPRVDLASGPAFEADLDAVTCGASSCEGAGYESTRSAQQAVVARLSPRGRPGVPAAPVELRARRAGRDVIVAWGQPIGSGGVPVAFYLVGSRVLGVGERYANTKKTGVSFAGVEATRTVVISVRARNVAGITGPSVTIVLRGHPR